MWVPTWPAVGVQVKAPAEVMAAPAGTVPASVKVRVSPASGSVAVAVKASWVSAVAVLSPTGLRTGAAFAADTTTSIVSQSERSPSETHTSKVWGPTWPAVGVQVKAPAEVMAAPAGTVPVGQVKVRVSPASGSVAVAVKASWVSAVAVLSPTGSRTGAAFAADTTTSIVSQSERSPSETHTSKVWGPTWPAVGVQVKAPAEVMAAPAGTVPARREGQGVARVGIRSGRREGELGFGGGGLVAHRVEDGGGVRRRHDHVDRLAVGEIAVGDAHVEGVGSDLACRGRPGEGAGGGDGRARGHRAGEREGQGVARVGIRSGRREGELGFGGGGLVAHRVEAGAALAADTTTSIVSQSERSPSETHTSKVWVPTWAPVGVQVKAPAEVMAAPAGTVPEVPLARVKVRVSPSRDPLRSR